MAGLDVFLGGPVPDFERIGRLQLEVLLHEGLHPTSNVLDVGCGCLRGGYWIMHFLDPGHYFRYRAMGRVPAGGPGPHRRARLLEQARPKFARNDDFDFSVFGETFDFVVARSVWTHASKPQIERMLDSFAVSGRQGAVFLASYLPASFSRRPQRTVGAGGKPHSPGALRTMRRVIPGSWERPDHSEGWSSGMVAHRREWLQTSCHRRGLTLRPLDYGVMNGQLWLRIDHPLPPG